MGKYSLDSRHNSLEKINIGNFTNRSGKIKNFVQILVNQYHHTAFSFRVLLLLNTNTGVNRRKFFTSTSFG